MRRLFWIGVGATLSVVVVRYGRALVARYVPAEAGRALGVVATVGRTARGVLGDFRAGMAEREAELRAALLGEDADLGRIEARGRAAWAGLRDQAGHPRHVPSAWVTGPLEDTDDDDGYAFF